ncbi:MAG TPA: flagellin [Oceanospirillaceae bacterium]|nr:flagellin [Oceanospirillaceae bacterium]
MAMVINSNIASLTSQRHLSQSRNEMEVAMERMSSGSRINSSMDDAAGLAIGNRMTSQIEGLNQAIRNANDGISLAQTAESALDSHSGILQRMRVLAVQAANDTYSTLDRKTLNNEIVQLKEELNRSVAQATFNGQKILDGSNTSFTFQVGHTANDKVTVTLSNMAGNMIGTQTYATKAGASAPSTANEVTGVTAPGTIAGAAATSSTTTGVVDGNKAVKTLAFSAGAAIGDKVSITMGTTTFSHTFTAAAANATAAAAAFDTAWSANGTANGAYTLTNSSGTLTFTQVANAGDISGTATYTKAAITAEQESYDFSGITLAVGDRVSVTVGSKTYTQEFATDQTTTLNALGALVVNGEAGYASKAVTSGKLVFTGVAAGTAMASATTAVQTASVSAANSIDDVLVTDSTSAKHALTVVDNALEMMADFRSRMGAVSNRMFHTVDNLMNVSENTSAARSRIMDSDFAAESANLAKSQVLQKAGTAMLSQANASTQDILSLLK